MYNHYFSNFGSPPVPNDICKDLAIGHARFWRRRFLKVFPIHMHREANLAILVDLPSLIIHAKVQPQGIFGSGKEDF